MKRTPVALACLVAVTGCAVTPIGGASPSVPVTTATASGTVTCVFRPGGEPARPVDPPSGLNVPALGTAEMTLTIGGEPVRLTLDRASAPCAVASFESLAAQGFYDGTACHRLSTTDMFILQCGDPTATGRGGPGYTFDDELSAGTAYPAGTLAMAHPPQPNTNGSQFFFVYADTELPPEYTVFGHLDHVSNEVISGIAYQGHDGAWGDGTGKPLADATITSVVSG